jgi:hypothetical protein
LASAQSPSPGRSALRQAPFLTFEPRAGLKDADDNHDMLSFVLRLAVRVTTKRSGIRELPSSLIKPAAPPVICNVH